MFHLDIEVVSLFYLDTKLWQAYITQCQTVDRETPDVSSSGIRYTLNRDRWMRIATSVFYIIG